MLKNEIAQVRVPLSILGFVTFLSGCAVDSEPTEVGASISATGISGTVIDGPVIGGHVVFEFARGQMLTAAVDDQARYQLSVTASAADFPVTATATDGIDLVTGDAPAFELMTSIMTPGADKIANLNPMGTLAVKIAQRLDGGMSEDNLISAIGMVESALDFGLDPDRFPNPIASEITVNNVAHVVKASQALAEFVRRTRAALVTIGITADVLDTLSADLVDGAVDGRGAIGADPRVAAVANIVSAQVVLESMANQLKVGGLDAAGPMDSGIRQIMAGASVIALTGSVVATESMLRRARVLVDAAMGIDANSSLAALRQSLELVVPGQGPREIATLLPAGGNDALNATIQQVSLASTEELEIVNGIVRRGVASTGGGNQPPSIAGNPATQVMVDAGYDFTPSASDADNDPLSFAISGQPAWASFDTGSGRLSGTPRSGDVGPWAGIQIRVSDGTATASMAAFAIEVVSAALGSASLSWTAPTQNTDDSFLTNLAGFKAYYGTEIGKYTLVDTIDNPTVTTHLVENLTPGTWYFVVTAFDTFGNESDESNIASKNVTP